MRKSLIALALVFLVFQSCKKADFIDYSTSVVGEFTQAQIASQNIVINPNGYCPLAGAIEFVTDIPVRVSLVVKGKYGPASDVSKDFPDYSTTHYLPVLGLYADYSNTVELSLYNSNNENLGTSSVTLNTAPLIPDMPSLTINANSSGKKSGMTLVSYFGHSDENTTLRPFIFDEFGDIRWYLDYSVHPILSNLYYDDGIERLQNGNLYFGDSNSGAIYEIDMLGNIINTWPLTGYDFHHEVLEKPNGNFLVSVSKHGLSTVEDFVIEIDRNSKAIIREWDFRQSLQYSRTTLTQNTSDWMHINALYYDASDDCIIVSGRTQCVVKVDGNNNVKWILAPHKDWGIAGNGTDLSTKLLQPLDANGQPITDQEILRGNINSTDFEWNWCQHATKLMPNGNLTLFDNGDQRNYTTAGPYSRAVEYKIDPVNMTVQQVWQYGKERGSDTYSRIVSDVDYDASLKHIFFSPGNLQNGSATGKAIEVNYNTKQVLFEATIHSPSTYSSITFHRTERMPLYP